MLITAKQIDRAFRLVPEGRAYFPPFGFGRGYVLDAAAEARLRRFVRWWPLSAPVLIFAMSFAVPTCITAVWGGFPQKYFKLVNGASAALAVAVMLLGIQLWLRSVPHVAVRMTYAEALEWRARQDIDVMRPVYGFCLAAIIAIGCGVGAYIYWNRDLSWVIFCIFCLVLDAGILLDKYCLLRVQQRMGEAKAAGYGTP